MKYKNKIAILGGDQRQYTAAIELYRKGWSVNLWGIYGSNVYDDGLEHYEGYAEALSEVSGMILPLPASTDGIYLNCPFLDPAEKIRLTDLIDYLDDKAVVIGGKLPAELLSKAEEKGIVVYDYFLSEDFQVKNAYITAEAALSIAMNRLDKSICGSRVAVTGYGRISKHLIRLLQGLGADITVVARKSSDLAWGQSSGCNTLRIGETPSLKENILELTHGYDVIYNTVPYWLFDKDFLERADKNTFIIDLASVPGGVDICAAKALGSNVLWATSLPGKYAPVSAGRIIASSVDEILRSEVT